MRFFTFTYFFLSVVCISCGTALPTAEYAADKNADEIVLPLHIRSFRIYGGDDERNPPIIARNPKNLSVDVPFASQYSTLEFDVNTDVPPNVYLHFVHCDALWQEDNNVFLNDIAFSRTSAIEWESAPYQSSYYTYRGRVSFPNINVKFKASGNWKAKIFEYGNDTTPLAEARFFVVDVLAQCDILLSSDFYEPHAKVSPAAFSIDALVSTNEPLFENQVHSVILYRNHRWHEPLVLSSILSPRLPSDAFNYGISSSVFGSLAIEKRFRIEGVPAQNEYRVLDLANTGYYPSGNFPARLPLPDLRRDGSYGESADDGASITRDVFSSNDDYINVEFQLDPERFPSRYPVYLVGSFNNWSIQPDWQMYYDKNENLYKLRQWIRRARHNYMYATGRLQAPYTDVDAITFEEFEGNTLSTYQTFVALVYYRDTSFGGYDAIIGIGASTIFGPVRR